MVADADGLWVVMQDLNVIRGFTKCILTPNAVEFDRIRRRIIDDISESSGCADKSAARLELGTLLSACRRSLCFLMMFPHEQGFPPMLLVCSLI